MSLDHTLKTIYLLLVLKEPLSNINLSLTIHICVELEVFFVSFVKLFQRGFQISLNEVEEYLLSLAFQVESHRISISQSSPSSNDKLCNLFEELEISRSVLLVQLKALLNLNLNLLLLLLSKSNSIVMLCISSLIVV